MTLARKNQICLESTPYYHLINRCVRRAFLCGYDKLTRKDYSHRKQWMVDRIRLLDEAFSIRICAYAIMSNHYHLVVCVDEESAKAWSQDEVLERYGKIHSTQRIRNLLESESGLTQAARFTIDETIELWRSRLMDISWFEKCLNEHIAKIANKEDEVNGRFWQGRFKSQPLLDDAALITCMVYVDLNPIRAGIASSPEASDFTSIQARFRQCLNQFKKNRIMLNGRKIGAAELSEGNKSGGTTKKGCGELNTQPGIPLVPFSGNLTSSPSSICLPMLTENYFELLDATGRAVTEGKRGSIPENIPSMLTQIGINHNNWLTNITHYRNRFPGMLGSVESIRSYVGKQKNRRRCTGLNKCASLYDTT